MSGRLLRRFPAHLPAHTKHMSSNYGADMGHIRADGRTGRAQVGRVLSRWRGNILHVRSRACSEQVCRHVEDSSSTSRTHVQQMARATAQHMSGRCRALVAQMPSTCLHVSSTCRANSEGERVEHISDVKHLSSRCRACVGQVTCTCSTPARHLLNIWSTPARHKLDTCSTTARHVLDTCSTLARHLLNSHSTLAPLFLNMEMCWRCSRHFTGMFSRSA